MNSSDGSVENGSSTITQVFPCISLIIPGHFYWFGWIYVYVDLGSVGIGSVGGFRGSLKDVYFEGIIS